MSIDMTEAEKLLEELIRIEEDTNERADEEKKAKQIDGDEDKAKALEMRKRAMETMGETRERLGKVGVEKRRRSGNQAMLFLEKAIETKQKMQEEEKRERREEHQEQIELQTAFLRQLEASKQQQTAQCKMTEQHLLQSIAMQQQQQQQQQMQQFAAMQTNMMALMEQQHQQSEMILELFKKGQQ
ncbi:nucleoporin GLE1-like [Dendronephthya gigantea]|uniref:nucleoporin GLE1-like n=1 Tax=Dendronephthya gigantea TaxID=151771 RepID=UPI00106BA533|nr:nucleoporin GLE1-like [Dendronephthya gigantea]